MVLPLSLWKTTYAFKALAFTYQILGIDFFIFFPLFLFKLRCSMLNVIFIAACLWRQCKNGLGANFFHSWPTNLKATQVKYNYKLWSEDSFINIVGNFRLPPKKPHPSDLRSHFKQKSFSWFWKNPARSLYSVKYMFVWRSVCLPAPPHSLVLLTAENKYLERKKREHFSTILDTRTLNIIVLKPLQGKQNLQNPQLASRLETNRTPRIIAQICIRTIHIYMQLLFSGIHVHCADYSGTDDP